jgi:hypothetical protein
VLKNFEEDLVVCINLLAEKEVDLEDIEVLEKYGPDDLVVPAPF